MIALVVEGAVGDDDVGWGVRGCLGFLAALLLRPDHDQGKLTGRLPHFAFLRDLLGIDRDVLGPLVVPRLGTLAVIVHLILGVLSTRVVMGRLFLLLMHHPPSSHDVESSLCLGDQFTILMLFKADVLLLGMFCVSFVLIY